MIAKLTQTNGNTLFINTDKIICFHDFKSHKMKEEYCILTVEGGVEIDIKEKSSSVFQFAQGAIQ
jgi:hypothetical protein